MVMETRNECCWLRWYCCWGWARRVVFASLGKEERGLGLGLIEMGSGAV